MTEESKSGNVRGSTLLPTPSMLIPSLSTQSLPSSQNLDTQQKKDRDNIIFIGNKPFMNYVTGVVMQFNMKDSNEVIVKARGKFISRAVDVVEVARKKFLSELKVKIGKIEIGSEEFENEEGKKVNVSIIEITLLKN